MAGQGDPIGYARGQLHEALQATNDFPGNEQAEGAVLTGWCVVAEWSAPDGEPYLSMLTSDAMGDDGQSPWRSKGMLEYAAQEMIFQGGDE